MNIAKLPNVLPPLPSINRIQSDLHIAGQIPTLHFSGDQAEIDHMQANIIGQDKVLTNMTYITLHATFRWLNIADRPNDVRRMDGVVIHIGGRSSRRSTKLSYNIKIEDKQGLFGYRRLKLRSLFSDVSYMREQIVYDLLQSSGVATTGFSYVRVFFNNRPLGLYGLIENYKNPWLKNEFAGGKKFDQGILYQGIYFSDKTGIGADLGYRGDNLTAYVDRTYKIKEPPKEGPSDFRKLMEFTRFLNTTVAEEPDAVEAWKGYVDIDSVIRNMVLEVLLGFADGYIVSMRNFYLYYNTDAKQLIYLPSDVDACIGTTIVKLADMWSGDYQRYPGFSLNRPLLKFIKVSSFKAQFEHLLVKLSKELISPDIVNPYIDDLANMIKEDVAWDMAIQILNIESRQDNQPEETETETRLHVPPPPVDPATYYSMKHREYVSFEVAVNGSNIALSVAGVKEWFRHQGPATLAHFNIAQ
ncbi:hypothetical protein DFQ28_008635 [Apophysomyces sp. BC1034]|nr:hypothetical protein DFQ29_007364 [Apophysomyces sp. BC1021]KAG0185884.1 hypothetical protein DFQ28_008635 [Apophysomyces sp. BC1034]